MEIFFRLNPPFPLLPLLSTSIVSASLQGGDLKSDIGFRRLNWSRMISEMEKWVRPAGNNFYRNGTHATLLDRNVKARRIINTRSRSFVSFFHDSRRVLKSFFKTVSFDLPFNLDINWR